MNLLGLPPNSDSSSFDRIPDSNILAFANKKKKKQHNKDNDPNPQNETVSHPSNYQEINHELNPQKINEEEINPEMQKIANGILVATVDSMASAFILSLAFFLFYEIMFPSWILFVACLAICFWHMLRNIYYYYIYSSNEEENDFKNKMISELFDEIFFIFIIVI